MKREQEHKQKVNNANFNAFKKEHNDKIWLAFNGLEEEDLIILKALYEMPLSDPDNKTFRMFRQFDLSLYERSIEKTNIPSGDRGYMPCIWIACIGDKVHLKMEEYFYEFLQYYSNTNEKKKL